MNFSQYLFILSMFLFVNFSKSWDGQKIIDDKHTKRFLEIHNRLITINRDALEHIGNSNYRGLQKLINDNPIYSSSLNNVIRSYHEDIAYKKVNANVYKLATRGGGMLFLSCALTEGYKQAVIKGRIEGDYSVYKTLEYGMFGITCAYFIYNYLNGSKAAKTRNVLEAAGRRPSAI